jgi:sulfhydrogenase subunit delta
MKPRIGVFGLSGCWGEQIVILNCEDELLALAGAVDFVDFPGASSANDEEGRLDIALVQGSVAGQAQADALRRIRARADLLVACGSCASFGGVNALETGLTREAMAEAVYGTSGLPFELAPHRPLRELVSVDVAIPGCPIEKGEFLRVVANLLNGDRPEAMAYPVCVECKMREQDCLLLTRHVPCAGPITVAGCNARCPGFGVGCIGCHGPVDEANLRSWKAILAGAGFDTDDLRRQLRTFAGHRLDDESAGLS